MAVQPRSPLRPVCVSLPVSRADPYDIDVLEELRGRLFWFEVKRGEKSERKFGEAVGLRFPVFRLGCEFRSS